MIAFRTICPGAFVDKLGRRWACRQPEGHAGEHRHVLMGEVPYRFGLPAPRALHVNAIAGEQPLDDAVRPHRGVG